MSDLPDELRDRAARAAADVIFEINTGQKADFDRVPWEWGAIVDAVAEVLAEHQDPANERNNLRYLNQRLSEVYEQTGEENAYLRVRVERAEADLARARAVVDAAEALAKYQEKPPARLGREGIDEWLIPREDLIEALVEAVGHSTADWRAAEREERQHWLKQQARSVSPDHTTKEVDREA